MMDFQGKVLIPLVPEPPHDGRGVQCCLCGKLRVFPSRRWINPPPFAASDVDGYVICPRCRS